MAKELPAPNDETYLAALEVLREKFTEEEIQEIRDLPNRQSRKNYGKDNIFKRRLMVNQLAAASFSNQQIADTLIVSKETVNSDREYARALYQQKILQNVDLHRARLLQEAIDLKDEAIAAFGKSKIKSKTTYNDNGEVVSKLVEETAGDVGFLNVAKNLIAEQAKIVGLDKVIPGGKEEKSYQDFLKDLSQTIARAEEDADEAKAKELAIEAQFIEAENVGPEGTQIISTIDERL
jgi:hypothetical protein